MSKVTFETHSLSFGYGDHSVIQGLNVSLDQGHFHAIVGPNGSGKSTLLNLLAGYLSPSGGSVDLNGRPLKSYASAERAQRVATVPQEFSFNFPFTVFDTVLMGRHPHIPRFARPSEDDLAIVRHSMETMDIAHLSDRTLSELSGGEKQRTIFARALAQNTPALLLDEPTSSMDIRHALAAMAELRQLAHNEGRTIVAVLHDLNMAVAHCDNVIVLKNGHIHCQGEPSTALTSETIHDVFGVQANVMKSESERLIITYESKV